MSRIKSLFNIIKLKIIYNLAKKKKYDIKVIPASKCVDEILSKKVSVARFGDGVELGQKSLYLNCLFY